MEYILDENDSPKNTKKIKYRIDENGCHVCTSHKPNPKGYPIKCLPDSKISMARYIWLMNTGVLTGYDEYILHSCGNTSCINIDHLYKSDTQGMVNKKLADGRQPRHSSLTDADIYTIKTNTTETAKELADRYNVSYSTIGNIWKERVFKYIAVDNYDEYCDKRRKRLIETRIAQTKKANKGRRRK